MISKYMLKILSTIWPIKSFCKKRTLRNIIDLHLFNFLSNQTSPIVMGVKGEKFMVGKMTKKEEWVHNRVEVEVKGKSISVYRTCWCEIGLGGSRGDQNWE